MAGEPDHVVQRRPVFRMRKSRRVGEVTVPQTDGLRPLVHADGELLLAAIHAFGKDDAGVIRHLHHDPFQQILDAQFGFERGKHGRRARRGAAGAPGMFGHAVDRVEADLAASDGIQHHFERHQLGERSRRKRLLLTLGEKHRTGRGLDHQGLGGLGFEQPRRRLLGQDG